MRERTRSRRPNTPDDLIRSRLRRAACLALVLEAGCSFGSTCGPSPSPISTRRPAASSAADPAERPKEGRLHVPLGTHVVVQGLLIHGPTKGFEDGTNIRVKRINGRATQERIRLKLALDNPVGVHWERVEHGVYEYPYVGQSYEIEGYEDGEFMGLTEDDLKHGVAVQAPMRHFHFEFVALRARRIDPVVLSPKEFLGRDALVEGIARTAKGHAMLAGEGWTVTEERLASWPPDVEGKLVQTNAVVRQTPAGDLTADSPWRLVRLEDQVGLSVDLRGYVLSVNDHWWFRYRGTDLYVDGMEHLPTWSADLHGQPVVVHGRLEQAMLPRIDQLTLKSPPDPAMQFIVRQATLERTAELLSPEVPDTQP